MFFSRLLWLMESEHVRYVSCKQALSVVREAVNNFMEILNSKGPQLTRYSGYEFCSVLIEPLNPKSISMGESTFQKPDKSTQIKV